MESIHQVKEALAARSQTTSLDELQSRGKKLVKVIRAEHIAAMIEQAVQRVIESSGLIPQEESNRLVMESREQFKDLMAERSRELEEARQNREQLEQIKERNHELEKALEVATARTGWLEEELERLKSAGAMNPELMMRMMGSAMRGGGDGGDGGDGQLADVAGNDGMMQAFEKMAASMTDRLEKIGRKMGVSSAVEADAVKFDALFNDLDGEVTESNIENMEVKQKTEGGIAGNLARLKKLKGGD